MQLISSILKILGFRLRGTLNTNGPGPSSLNEILPAEILAHIATFLKPADLANLQLLSQDFHALSHDAFDIAWQPHLEKLKEIDPTVSLLPSQDKTRQVRVKEHFTRIAQEQFEEIKDFKSYSLDRSSVYPALSVMTEPAKTLSEMYEREQLLNKYNTDLIKREIDQNDTMLELWSKGLTRFPKQLLEEQEYTSYWSGLTALILKKNFIKCLPDGLGAFCTALERLDCSDNKLTVLPDLSNFTALKHLDCSNNKVTVLPDLSNCTVLQILFCFRNELTALPDLNNCTVLEALNCWDNKLTVLPDLSNCIALKWLRCQKNKLTTLPELARFTAFLELNCSSNKLTAIPDLSNCTLLEVLNCASNELTAIPDLSNCTALEVLNCWDNKLTVLPDLSNCTVLRWLRCQKNKLTTLPELARLIVLKVLNCISNELTAIPDLSNCVALHSLNCSANKLTAIPDLSNCTELQILDCKNNRLTVLPNLRASLVSLDCSNNELTALPQSLANCNNLKALSLHNNYLKTIPDEIRARFKVEWHIDSMASQKSLFLMNMRKHIKAIQSYLKAIGKNCVTQFIEMVKAPSEHPLKVGLLSALSFAAGSMCFISSSGILAPSILLGGLVTLGIKTKNHFANKALQVVEQQLDLSPPALLSEEKGSNNWYQYAKSCFNAVIFSPGRQRNKLADNDNDESSEPENASPTILKP